MKIYYLDKQQLLDDDNNLFLKLSQQSNWYLNKIESLSLLDKQCSEICLRLVPGTHIIRIGIGVFPESLNDFMKILNKQHTHLNFSCLIQEYEQNRNIPVEWNKIIIENTVGSTIKSIIDDDDNNSPMYLIIWPYTSTFFINDNIHHLLQELQHYSATKNILCLVGFDVMNNFLMARRAFLDKQHYAEMFFMKHKIFNDIEKNNLSYDVEINKQTRTIEIGFILNETLTIQNKQFYKNDKIIVYTYPLYTNKTIHEIANKYNYVIPEIYQDNMKRYSFALFHTYAAYLERSWMTNDTFFSQIQCFDVKPFDFSNPYIFYLGNMIRSLMYDLFGNKYDNDPLLWEFSKLHSQFEDGYTFTHVLPSVIYVMKYILNCRTVIRKYIDTVDKEKFPDIIIKDEIKQEKLLILLTLFQRLQLFNLIVKAPNILDKLLSPIPQNPIVHSFSSRLIISKNKMFFYNEFPVTNGQFLQFIQDKGYKKRELWSPQFWDKIQQQQRTCPITWAHYKPNIYIVHQPTPEIQQVYQVFNEPVCVCLEEAKAYCTWKGDNARIITASEYNQIMDKHKCYDNAMWELTNSSKQNNEYILRGYSKYTYDNIKHNDDNAIVITQPSDKTLFFSTFRCCYPK